MNRRSQRWLFSGAFTLALLGAQVTACSSSDSSEGSGAAGSGTGSTTGTGSTPGAGSGVGLNTGGSGSSGGNGSGTSTAPANPNDNCGTTTNELKKKPADLLLVLDRSSSMNRAMDSSDTCNTTSTTCDQRWETMTTSLSSVLDTSPTDVYWGLKFFTSPQGGGTNNRCYVGPGVEVPVAAGSAATIKAQIDAAGTSSSTPTRVAIETAITYLDTVTDGNPKYILLATDGEPNCAPGSSSTTASDLTATIEAVGKATAAGYKVFVIGVGPEVGNLTAMAQAGGTTDFYSANSPAELSSALTSIVGTVAAGCSYPVDSAAVTNPNGIGVYLDKALVPQNATNGWSIDAGHTVITLNGTYCDEVTAGTKSQVEIYLPCKPDDPLPPIIE